MMKEGSWQSLVFASVQLQKTKPFPVQSPNYKAFFQISQKSHSFGRKKPFYFAREIAFKFIDYFTLLQSWATHFIFYSSGLVQ